MEVDENIAPAPLPVEEGEEPVVEQEEAPTPEPEELIPPPEEDPAPVVDMDEDGREPHPVCGHYEYRDRWNPSGPCNRCLKDIEREYASRQPHPICGCLKPVWSFRTDGGPCGQCLKDIEREYNLVPDPRINDPLPTLDDVRAWRVPKLEETDWVDTNPGRVAREPEAYVEAMHQYRQALFDITDGFTGVLVWPVKPNRADY